MHPITIKVPENIYNAAKDKAQSRGYFSIEEYISDWLENDASDELLMSPEIAMALNEGLADIQAGRVITFEDHKRSHAEYRAAWIRDNQA